ncbi:MAG TPA: DUF4234 domain-containing protein [Clostridiales bacterium]|jgi:hypothetical protein|nr:DUF4234 domain-containing protein [Clostridiales bacterium]
MTITKRSIVTSIILTFITFGFYGIYWGIKLADESVKVKDPNDSGFVEKILMVFVPFAGCYLAERKLSEGCEARGIRHADNSILYLVLGLFGYGLISWALMQNDLNQLAENPVMTYGNNHGAQPQNPPYQSTPDYNQPQYAPPVYDQYQQQYAPPVYEQPQQQNTPPSDNQQ